MGSAGRVLARGGRRRLGVRLGHRRPGLRHRQVPRGARAQAERSLDTIEAALKKAGAKMTDVVRVRVYVPRRADVVAVSGVVKRRLGAARAANTTVCAPLAVAGARVEIEVTARKRVRSRRR